MMQYREWTPTASLIEDVECFWLLEGYDAPGGTSRERLLPDGCIELIVNLAAPFREHADDGGSSIQPARVVAGQMTRPVFVTPTGAVRLFGVRFTPGGSVAFLDGPPSELTNHIVALDDVARQLSRRLESCLDPDAPASELVDAVNRILVDSKRASDGRGVPIQAAVSRVLRSGGQASVDRLASELGLSGRQLERRFVGSVGIGPKLLSRILRFQQVFRAVESADARWASVAADCGYYDQSHLIRDVRQFAGETPTGLLDELSLFGEFFTRKHRASDSSKTGRAG